MLLESSWVFGAAISSGDTELSARGPNLLPLEKLIIARDYLDGMPIKLMMAKYGHSHSTILRVARELELKRRRPRKVVGERLLY
jgi:hypothetical protein